MPLTGSQVRELARTFDAEWDLPRLGLFASDKLDIKLSNIATTGSMYRRAFDFISYVNACRPLRDREFLEKLRDSENQALAQVAGQLLNPPFFSPDGDVHHAIVLGKEVFVDRAELRSKIREFTDPKPLDTRVLIVRGEEPCGKSYTWSYLRHLAVNHTGARPRRLPLTNTNYTVRQFFEQIFMLLKLDNVVLPEMADDPQQARIDPLLNKLKGQLSELDAPYWLVIDDLNDPSVTPAVREAAYAVACAVEDTKPENLWVALLGYNAPITDSGLRLAAQDDARFPDADKLTDHFEYMSTAGLTRRTLKKYTAIVEGAQVFQDNGFDVDEIRNWATAKMSSRDVRSLGSALASAEPGAPILNDFQDYFRAGVDSSLQSPNEPGES